MIILTWYDHDSNDPWYVDELYTDNALLDGSKRYGVYVFPVSTWYCRIQAMLTYATRGIYDLAH